MKTRWRDNVSMTIGKFIFWAFIWHLHLWNRTVASEDNNFENHYFHHSIYRRIGWDSFFSRVLQVASAWRSFQISYNNKLWIGGQECVGEGALVQRSNGWVIANPVCVLAESDHIHEIIPALVNIRFRWSRCQMKAQNMNFPIVILSLSHHLAFILKIAVF